MDEDIRERGKAPFLIKNYGLRIIKLKEVMSRIKPMELISKMSGKLCSHSDIYFAERNGT